MLWRCANTPELGQPEQEAVVLNIPYGYCHCGCGEQTSVAPHNRKARGWVKGKPLKYIKDHQRRSHNPPSEEPNPLGLCKCGCGLPSPLARQTESTRGYVKGKPKPYILGHARSKPRPQFRYHLEDRNYETPCWIWLGCKTIGYGSFERNGRLIMAHRFFYELRHGPIPAEYVLHHKCRERSCVNPDHTRPMSASEHGRLHARDSHQKL